MGCDVIYVTDALRYCLDEKYKLSRVTTLGIVAVCASPLPVAPRHSWFVFSTIVLLTARMLRSGCTPFSRSLPVPS